MKEGSGDTSKPAKSRGKAAAGAATTAQPAEEAMTSEHSVWRLVFSVDVQIFSMLFLAAACIFSNGIRGTLTFDDHLAIDKNHDAWADKTPLSDVFYDDFWGKSLDQIESNGSYRPLTVLTFRLQHWLMGYRHSPTFLHSFNYVVAFMNVCLVFYLARLYVYVLVPASLLSLEKANTPSFTALLTSPLHAVPMVAALLYLVHPVHVDAVTSIVGRCELLYCFFGLLGLFSVHRYLNQADECKSGKGRAAVPPPVAAMKGKPASGEERRRPMRAAGRFSPLRYVLFAAYALVASILCKDSAITFTAVYGVHACVMYACSRCSGRRTLLVVATSVLELVSYLVFRRSFIGHVDLEKSPLLRRTENPQYFVPKGLFHWLSIRWVIQVKNMELLFFPTSLCCEYSFNCIPHLYNLQDPRVPYFIAVTAVTVAAVVAFLYGTFVRRSRTAMVGLVSFLWIAIPYAPVSHLFIAVGTFIAERCLYVPSIGAVLLITYTVAAPGLRRGVVPYHFYALLLLCAGWGVFAYNRNFDWLSDERLFRAAMKTCPESGKVRTQLAAIVSMREKTITPEIVELATRSVELDPDLRDGYYYMAVNEFNTKRNVRQAYLYLRECLQDVFSLPSCRDTYEQVRRVVRPNLTEMEQLIDDASLTTINASKAVALRQAAIYALQKERRPCMAEAILEEALDLWNTTQIYWVSDPVRRVPGEPTYCNAMYWYPQAMMLCEQEATEKADDASEEDSSRSSRTNKGGDGAMPTEKSPGLPTAAEAARKSTELAERLRMCGTNWREAIAQPKQYQTTYGNRMMQFLTLSDTTMSLLERYLNFTQSTSVEREAVLLAMLDVSVRQYCHISEILKDTAVREKLAAPFSSNVRALEQGFSTLRQVRLPQLRSARRELKLSTSLSAQQEQQMRDILAASKCSEDLSFLSL